MGLAAWASSPFKFKYFSNRRCMSRWQPIDKSNLNWVCLEMAVKRQDEDSRHRHGQTLSRCSVAELQSIGCIRPGLFVVWWGLPFHSRSELEYQRWAQRASILTEREHPLIFHLINRLLYQILKGSLCY